MSTKIDIYNRINKFLKFLLKKELRLFNIASSGVLHSWIPQGQ